MQFYRISVVLLLNIVIFSQDLEDLSFGDDNSLDIATWNIEWFPKNGQATVEYVTQILQQLDLDILAMQELDNKDMFDQMFNELTNYTGYYESAWFAGLAYIYKPDVVQINNIYEIYTTSPYWSAFPRSPMVMDMSFMGENYFIINNHFKCCGDGTLDMNDESDEEKKYRSGNYKKEMIELIFVVQDEPAGDKEIKGNKKGPFAVAKPVKVGISSETHYEIISGLDESERIVTGSYKAISRDLKHNSIVRVDEDNRN